MKFVGRYQIISEIGRGGMATVYRAHDPQNDRDVAVKLLHHEYLNDLGFRARFEREAQTISGLKHPAIVPLIEFGQQASSLYMTMEYMPNGSLADFMEAGRLTIAMTAKIVERVCAALDYAHNRGVVHRDLKPSNILFDHSGDAFLADFGIALQATALGSSGETISGTPAYMSPEQSRSDGVIDGRSDLYALGINIFKMLTGRIPFDAETAVAIMHKQREESLPSPRAINPNLPAEVEPFLYTALAKDPGGRFQTGAELSNGLNRALGLDPPETALWASDPTAPDYTSELSAPLWAEHRSGLQHIGPKAISAREDETFQIEAARWLENRPLAATVLVSLLGILCAAIAVTLIRAPAFLSANDRDGSTVNSSLSGTELGSSLDDSASPTSSVPGLASTSRPNMMMVYTDAALTVINVSTGDLSLDQVQFKRVGEGSSTAESTFPAEAWDNLPGQTDNTLSSGGCFQLLTPGHLAAGSEPEPILLPSCESPPGWLIAHDESWIFWLLDEEDAEFEVLQGDRLIHVCALGDGRCSFYLPQD